jgi:hypothetical protein
MDKSELMGLTLDMLIAKFEESPESFEFLGQGHLNEATHPTIIWQPKIQLSDLDSTLVNDPNNASAIMVTFNHVFNEMQCHVFIRAPITTYGSKADSSIKVCRWFEKWRRNYRKFKKLKQLILNRYKHQEDMEFARHLSSVFPDALDRHLFRNNK